MLERSIVRILIFVILDAATVLVVRAKLAIKGAEWIKVPGDNVIARRDQRGDDIAVDFTARGSGNDQQFTTVIVGERSPVAIVEAIQFPEYILRHVLRIKRVIDFDTHMPLLQQATPALSVGLSRARYAGVAMGHCVRQAGR